MPQLLRSIAERSAEAGPRGLSLGALRLAPWIVFGPITGLMSEAAIAAFRRGRPALGGLYIALNIGILAGMPLLTAALVSHR
jgi:hypothetical protein